MKRFRNRVERGEYEPWPASASLILLPDQMQRKSTERQNQQTRGFDSLHFVLETEMELLISKG